MKELFALGGLLVLVSAVLAALGFRGRDQVVGIDLGTTFSVVALKHADKITVVPDYVTGKVLLPSQVTFFPNGSTAVGHAAVALRSKLPQHTIFNAKRFIGRSLLEVSNDVGLFPFTVAANSSESQEDPAAGFLLPAEGEQAGRWISPIDVGAKVVQHMKRSVSEYVGYPISRAVICVPAKFTVKETEATQKAFEKAGFKVMRILEEPTAAAVAYNLHKGTGTRHVLVYDIGGGTLDTSLLYMSGTAVTVLGVAGDDHLGGSDFDLRMRDLLQAKLPTAELDSSTAMPEEGCDTTGLHILAEEAKIQLSSEIATQVKCSRNGQILALQVTRKEFEDASEDLFNRSMAPVHKVLRDQLMTPDHVDDVVLVGGASRTPKLRALLQALFGPGKRLHTEIDPDITVAYGAANILD